MADMSVNVCGVDFKNPIIPASGVFGYGREYEELFSLDKLGGMATATSSPNCTTSTASAPSPSREPQKNPASEIPRPALPSVPAA